MLMKGELEVYQGNPPTRLGFLAEGSFFGESAILDSSGSDIRTRTVVAVSDCELCFITRDDIQMIGSMYPELEARLRRFKTIGKRRLNTKGLKQVDREALKEYASTFKEMRAEVQRHEQARAREYQLADDTVHVGGVPSHMPPHPEAMTEEMLAQRFAEFGEVQTAVIRYRRAEPGKPNNSWALVAFKGDDGTKSLLQGKKEGKCEAKRPDTTPGANGAWVPALDQLGQGWQHTVRRVDPTQALESTGSFAAIFEICRKRVMGDKERAGRDVLPSLKAMADSLRQKDAEQLAEAENQLGAEAEQAHLEMMGLADSAQSALARWPSPDAVREARQKAEPASEAKGEQLKRTSSSWWGGDDAAAPEPAPEPAPDAPSSGEGAADMAQLMAMVISMNNRLKAQDAELVRPSATPCRLCERSRPVPRVRSSRLLASSRSARGSGVRSGGEPNGHGLLFYAVRTTCSCDRRVQLGLRSRAPKSKAK